MNAFKDQIDKQKTKDLRKRGVKATMQSRALSRYKSLLEFL